MDTLDMEMGICSFNVMISNIVSKELGRTVSVEAYINEDPSLGNEVCAKYDLRESLGNGAFASVNATIDQEGLMERVKEALPDYSFGKNISYSVNDKGELTKVFLPVKEYKPGKPGFQRSLTPGKNE